MSRTELLTRWYLSDQGCYLFDRHYDLLSALIRGWPRRETKLLQIGCGDGRFLYRLWDEGYTVTGIDDDPVLLDMTKRCLGDRGEVMPWKSDCLPFEDGEFDYAVLPLAFELLTDPKAALMEALRVTTAGVAFLFPNRFSCLPMYADRIGYPKDCRVFVPPYKARELATRITEGASIELKTMLPLPPGLWRTSMRFVNTTPLVLPIGICAGIRINKNDDLPVTPLTVKAKPRRHAVADTLQG